MSISLHRRWLRRAGALRAANGGNVAIVFALSLVPLVGAIGAAVDYSRIGDIRSRLQLALDSAVLSAECPPALPQPPIDFFHRHLSPPIPRRFRLVPSPLAKVL